MRGWRSAAEELTIEDEDTLSTEKRRGLEMKKVGQDWTGSWD